MGINMVIRNYNTTDNLVVDFMTEALLLDKSKLPRIAQREKQINRKLNKKELEFIIEINKDEDLQKHSRKIADLLEQGNYIEAPSYSLNTSQLSLLREQYNDLIKKINLTFTDLNLDA